MSGSPEGKSKKGPKSSPAKGGNKSNNSSFSSSSTPGKKSNNSSFSGSGTPAKNTTSSQSTAKASAASGGSKPQQRQQQAAKQLSAEGLRNNEIVVPSPLYALYWLDEKTIIVGGGGGEAKFGMPNIFVMLRMQTPSSENGNLFWKQVASLQLGEEIVWCCSEPRLMSGGVGDGGKDKKKGEETPPLTYHISYSSKGKCQTLVCTCDSENDKKCDIKLLASCKVVAKDDDEDKKPIAVAGSTVFVAQDDNTVAVVEADTCNNLGTIDKFEGTPLWTGRIRTMLAKTVTGSSGSDRFCLITGSEDKRVLILLVEREKKNEGAATSWSVLSCNIMTEKTMNLKFTLMPSSYKSMHWDDCSSSSNSSSGFIVNAYDTHRGDSHLIQFGDVITPAGQIKVTAPVNIAVVRKDCVTDVCQNDSSKKGTVIVGTADGQLMELSRRNDGAIQGTPPLRLQSQLHFISITQVARNDAGVLASTDIGQRVNLTQTLAGGGKPGSIAAGLPLTFNKFWRVFIVFLFFIAVITAYVLLLL